jgi:ribosomal protein S18 acetylase RimI-like enzyme
MPSLSSQVVTVTTTYLEIPSRAAFRPAILGGSDLLLLEAREALPAFYRFLYDAVGHDYAWTERLHWSDAELQTYLDRPTVTLLVLYYHGTPAGYVELDSASSEPGTQVVYFGIIPAFHGRGFGKHLLSAGVQHAFDNGAERVWLHTCTLDGPYALANYRARGFVEYKTTTHQQVIAGG